MRHFNAGLTQSFDDVSEVQTIFLEGRANGVMVQTFAKPLRFTRDGSTPSATHGFEIAVEEGRVIIPVRPNQTFKIIETEASATCTVEPVVIEEW